MDSATAAPDVSTDNQGPVAPPSWADAQPAQPAARQPMQTTPSDSSALPGVAKQPEPQYSQPAVQVPVTITPQKRDGILGVIDSVMDALTGTTKPEIATGSDGNKYVNQAPIGHAAQWVRLADEALEGAGAGMAAGRGNNAGGAAAAGISKGVEIGNQRAQAPQKLSEEAQQANLEKANMQMVTMRNAQLAWTLKHDQVQASQEAVKFAEDQADYMEKSGAVMIGHMGDHGDLGDVLKNDPDAPKSLVQDSTIKTVPTFDENGNPTGVDVYKVSPDFNKEMLPPGTPFNTFDPTTGKQVVNRSSAPMTRGQKYVYDSTAANAEMEFRKKQADIDKEQADTDKARSESEKAPSEIRRNNAEAAAAGARAAVAPSEIAKNNAEAAKANATNPGTAANQKLIDDIGTGQVAVDRLGYLLAKNPELINAVTAKYPDFDTSKVGGYVNAVKEFTSTKKGSTGAALNSGGTAMKHLAELDALNTPASHIPGTPAYNAYHNKLDTLAPELATFYGDSTIPAIASLKATLGAQMPGARHAAIQTQAQSMGQKFDSYEQSWKNAAPSAQYIKPMPNVDDNAKEARAKLDPAYRARLVQEMQPKGGPQPVQLQPGEVPLVNPKTQQQIVPRNGQWVDVKTGQAVQ